MAFKATVEAIEQINKLYYELKSYAAVSRALGGTPSASTVKKYVIPDYVPPVEVFEPKSIELPPFDPTMFDEDIFHWGPHLVPTAEERKGIEELWKELTI